MQPNAAHKSTNRLIEHFFRHQYGKTASQLMRQYGTQNFENIEDAVQEALMKALRTWPFRGIPDNPEGWIFTVAKNSLVDHLRKNNRMSVLDYMRKVNPKIYYEQFPEEIDEILQLMLACCHPSISSESQIILILKILCGFSTAEVARALIKSDEAVIKAYTRGKSRFKDHVKELTIPSDNELGIRIDGVLKILYLLFNEGYHSIHNDALIRKDLCNEALRLTQLLLKLDNSGKEKIHALIALMQFHISRFDERTDDDNALVTLDQQDRKKWDHERILQGNIHLALASSSTTVNEYYLQAGIAGYHCNADSFNKTNWEGILQLYDLLVLRFPGFVYRLNRIIALYYAKGAKSAKSDLEKLKNERGIRQYKLFYAISAFIYEKNHDIELAILHYGIALKMSTNNIEMNHFRKKITLLEKNKPPM